MFEEEGFGQVLRNTVVWVVLVVGITVLISLALAQLLDQRFPGRRVVRWALIVPWAASLVMTAAIWKWMLNYYYGIINGALQWVGLIDKPRDWLGDASTVVLRDGPGRRHRLAAVHDVRDPGRPPGDPA